MRIFLNFHDLMFASFGVGFQGDSLCLKLASGVNGGGGKQRDACEIIFSCDDFKSSDLCFSV